MFDFVVGNPPYQLEDGGYNRCSVGLYNRFMDVARSLNPKRISLIIPARWYSSGKGLSEFRRSMLIDKRFRLLLDFPDSKMIFSGVRISAGVCFFFWDRDYTGNPRIVNVYNNGIDFWRRPLDEFPYFVRYNKILKIIKKVLAKDFRSVKDRVLGRKPFNVLSFHKPLESGDIRIKTKFGEGWWLTERVKKNRSIIHKWKTVTHSAAGDNACGFGKDGTRKILVDTEVIPPGMICSESYIITGVFDTEQEAQNMAKYLMTKFARFLMLPLANNTHVTRQQFYFVPDQDFSREVNEDELFERYGFTQEEIALVRKSIR